MRFSNFVTTRTQWDTLLGMQYVYILYRPWSRRCVWCYVLCLTFAHLSLDQIYTLFSLSVCLYIWVCLCTDSSSTLCLHHTYMYLSLHISQSLSAPSVHVCLFMTTWLFLFVYSSLFVSSTVHISQVCLYISDCYICIAERAICCCNL